MIELVCSESEEMKLLHVRICSYRTAFCHLEDFISREGIGSRARLQFVSFCYLDKQRPWLYLYIVVR